MTVRVLYITYAYYTQRTCSAQAGVANLLVTHVQYHLTLRVRLRTVLYQHRGQSCISTEDSLVSAQRTVLYQHRGRSCISTEDSHVSAQRTVMYQHSLVSAQRTVMYQHRGQSCISTEDSQVSAQRTVRYQHRGQSCISTEDSQVSAQRNGNSPVVELRTCDRKVSCSSPGRSGGKILGHGQLSMLTPFSVSAPPPCYFSGA